MSMITKTKYSVEYRYSYGWDDAHWTRGDGRNPEGLERWLFDSVEEAQAEIDDFCSVPEPDKPYTKKEFRVVIHRP